MGSKLWYIGLDPKTEIYSERERTGLYNICIEFSCQALSVSVVSSQMDEVAIMEYNSFSVDYSESFKLNLVQIMRTEISINCL